MVGITFGVSYYIWCCYRRSFTNLQLTQVSYSIRVTIDMRSESQLRNGFRAYPSKVSWRLAIISTPHFITNFNFNSFKTNAGLPHTNLMCEHTRSQVYA